MNKWLPSRVIVLLLVSALNIFSQEDTDTSKVNFIPGSTDTSKIIYGGNGIPIYFEGKFPVRNDRIKK